jgi:uncharacterized coiled-coil DUF342 family protein
LSEVVSDSVDPQSQNEVARLTKQSSEELEGFVGQGDEKSQLVDQLIQKNSQTTTRLSQLHSLQTDLLRKFAKAFDRLQHELERAHRELAALREEASTLTRQQAVLQGRLEEKERLLDEVQTGNRARVPAS